MLNHWEPAKAMSSAIVKKRSASITSVSAARLEDYADRNVIGNCLAKTSNGFVMMKHHLAFYLDLHEECFYGTKLRTQHIIL